MVSRGYIKVSGYQIKRPQAFKPYALNPQPNQIDKEYLSVYGYSRLQTRDLTIQL